jgi:sensor domain CHASE-containing protein
MSSTESLLTAVLPLVIGGVFLLIKVIKEPGSKKQAHQENAYKVLVNELNETNKGIREELLVLKEKVNSIEKMLKEVS